MSHLSDFQIQEYVSKDCSFLSGLLRKFHLGHCAACQKRAEVFLAAKREQESFGCALKEFHEYSVQAEATLKMPKGEG